MKREKSELEKDEAVRLIEEGTTRLLRLAGQHADVLLFSGEDCREREKTVNLIGSVVPIVHQSVQAGNLKRAFKYYLALTILVDQMMKEIALSRAEHFL